MKPVIDVKVASDVVCPWCYIGKRNLEKAVDHLSDRYEVRVQYLPFELAPDMPEEGMSFRRHITEKFGDFDTFIQRGAMLNEKGREAGIDFKIANIDRSPNTFSIHRIIQFAHQYGLQTQVKEAFMKAYFVDLVDLTLIQNVIQVAVSAGLQRPELEYLLNSEDGVKEVLELEDNIRRIGVTGVPFFIIDNRYGISGAVPPAQLEEAMIQAAAENSLQQDIQGDSCSTEGCE